MRSLILLVISASLLPTICPGQVQKFEDARPEIYKIASDTDLHIHIFEPEGHDPKKDKRPAIVFFFGGGWTSGTPAQFEQHARYLAKRGMVAAAHPLAANAGAQMLRRGGNAHLRRADRVACGHGGNPPPAR